MTPDTYERIDRQLLFGRPSKRVSDPASKLEQVRRQVDQHIGDILPCDMNIAVRVITLDYPLLQIIRDTRCVVGWRD